MAEHINIVGSGVTWTATTFGNAGDIITVVSKKKEPTEFCYFHTAVGYDGIVSSRYMRITCPHCGVFKIVSICATCARDIASYRPSSMSSCKDCGKPSLSKQLWVTIGDVPPV